MTNVIIAGSRHMKDYETLKEFCDQWLSDIRSDITVISGGCAGADTLGEQYAAERGHEVKRFPADWKSHGKAAGPIRNREMAKVGDILIAFAFDDSRGTANMIKEAKSHGLEVHVKHLRVT